MMNLYTNICIDIYFGLWMMAEEMVSPDGGDIWQVILNHYDAKYLK